MCSGVANVLEIFSITVVAHGPEPLLDYQLCKSNDGVERRAQLVTDLRKKFGFRGRSGFRPLLGLNQRSHILPRARQSDERVRRLPVPDDIDQFAFEREVVSTIQLDGHYPRTRSLNCGERLDEQLVQSTCLDQALHAFMTRPAQKAWIGIKKRV